MVAREAYSLYVTLTAEGANDADGPSSAACYGGGGRTRTSDTGLMRPLLCHLSYAAENRVDTKNALL